MKLATLPKKRPGGVAIAIKSAPDNIGIPLNLQKKYAAITTPRNPP